MRSGWTIEALGGSGKVRKDATEHVSRPASLESIDVVSDRLGWTNGLHLIYGTSPGRRSVASNYVDRDHNALFVAALECSTFQVGIGHDRPNHRCQR